MADRLHFTAFWPRILPYVYVMRLKLLVSLAYRFDVITTLVTNVILLVGTVFLWRTAYRDLGTVAAVNESQMITYAVLAVALRSFFTCNVESTLNDRIREGNIAMDLIKPVHLIGLWLSEDIGSACSAVTLRTVPILLVSCLFFTIPAPADLPSFLLFLPAVLLSYALLWMLSVLTGLMTFWTMELGGLQNVKGVLVDILSGALVPMWFFPGWFQNIAKLLPFQHIYQTPLAIYIGRISPGNALDAIGLQVVWSLILILATRGLWMQACRRTMVQGG